MGNAWDALTKKKQPDYSDWKSGETPEQYAARHKAPEKKPSFLDTVTAPMRARKKLIGGLDTKKGK